MENYSELAFLMEKKDKINRASNSILNGSKIETIAPFARSLFDESVMNVLNEQCKQIFIDAFNELNAQVDEELNKFSISKQA